MKMGITKRNMDGNFFQGKTIDADAAAKMQVLKKALDSLRASSFLKEYEVQDAPNNPTTQIILTFPAVITFRGDMKGLLPSMLNLADSYVIMTSENQIRVTLMITDYWKE